MSERRVEIAAETVTKYGAPRPMAIEAEKTRRACLLGQTTGLFVAPSVVDFDPKSGRLVLERLEDLRTSREYFWRPDPDVELARQAGQALAVIHRTLGLPDDMVVPLGSQFRRDVNVKDVFLHGDFTVANVCVSGDRLTILDWQASVGVGGTETTGPGYFDVAWFLKSLFFRPSPRGILSRGVVDVAEAFVTGYLVEAPEGTNRQDLFRYVEQLLEEQAPAVFRKTRFRTRLLLPRSIRMLRAWLHANQDTAEDTVDEAPTEGTDVSYRTSHQAVGKGAAYHDRFSQVPYRAMLWGLEREVLDGIVAEYFPGRTATHLDFACGTGRVLGHLQSQVGRSVGVDVSESMLGVARERLSECELVMADLTREQPFGEERFDLVTAFRFFPNAEAALRNEAMAAIARHMNPSSILVFNNHRNTQSVRSRIFRLAGRRGFTGLSPQEAKKMVEQAGMKIVGTQHLSVFPASEDLQVLPIPVLRAMERSLSKVRPLRDVAEDIIYICRLAD